MSKPGRAFGIDVFSCPHLSSEQEVFQDGRASVRLEPEAERSAPLGGAGPPSGHIS